MDNHTDLPHAADDTLQIGCFPTGYGDRMIGAGAAAFQNLQITSGVNCHLRDEFLQCIRSDEAGAAARHEHTITVE